MYFTSKIEIDPSQITKIKRIKKNSLMGSLAAVISKDSKDSKIEMETFTVVSILNQISEGLLKLEIDNIIRLSINGFDFYLDKEEKEHDLRHAIKVLDKQIDPIESERFENIELVLEHNDDNFKYYISISISRKHKVGEYPIKIITNGLVNEFYTEKFDEKHIVTLMKDKFEDQITYNNMVEKYRTKFEVFNMLLNGFLAKFIKVDGVNYKILQKIVRPKFESNNIRKINFNYDSEPAFHGYSGINKYFTYNLFWMELCRASKLECSKFIVVDHNGKDAISYENKSIKSHKSSVFNITEEIEADDIKNEQIFEDGYFSNLSVNSDRSDTNFDDIYKNFHYEDLNINEF